MSGILLFFDISTGEILIILVIAFLVFGPQKFPELARKIGRGINEVKRASESIRDEITREADKIEKEVDISKDVDIEKDLDVKDDIERKTGKDRPASPGK